MENYWLLDSCESEKDRSIFEVEYPKVNIKEFSGFSLKYKF
jgi:hypothetical protein